MSDECLEPGDIIKNDRNKYLIIKVNDRCWGLIEIPFEDPVCKVYSSQFFNRVMNKQGYHKIDSLEYVMEDNKPSEQ